MNAKFITIEGIEGVGKSTAMQFIRDTLQAKKIDVICTREPGGTPFAEKIRDLCLEHSDEKIAEDTELLLMFAARAQHVARVIKPALAKGQWVLSDRFTDASFAYQGGGRQIPLARIDTLAKWVLGDFTPDMTILLDAPVDVALTRANKRSAPDRIEKEAQEFFKRVRDVYLQRAQQFPKQYCVVDANQPLSQVSKQLADILNGKLNKS